MDVFKAGPRRNINVYDPQPRWIEPVKVGDIIPTEHWLANSGHFTKEGIWIQSTEMVDGSNVVHITEELLPYLQRGYQDTPTWYDAYLRINSLFIVLEQESLYKLTNLFSHQHDSDNTSRYTIWGVDQYHTFKSNSLLLKKEIGLDESRPCLLIWRPGGSLLLLNSKHSNPNPVYYISISTTTGKDVTYSDQREWVEAKVYIRYFKIRESSRTGMHWKDHHLFIHEQPNIELHKRGWKVTTGSKSKNTNRYLW